MQKTIKLQASIEVQINTVPSKNTVKIIATNPKNEQWVIFEQDNDNTPLQTIPFLRAFDEQDIIALVLNHKKEGEKLLGIRLLKDYYHYSLREALDHYNTLILNEDNLE